MKVARYGGAVIIALTATAAVGSPRDPLSSLPAHSPARIADYDVLLSQYDAEEDRIHALRQGVGDELVVVKARINARGRVHYKHVRAGLLPAGGGFDALVDYAADVERTRVALVRDLETAARLEQQLADLTQRADQLASERAPLEVHREAVQRAKVALKQSDDRRAAFERAFQNSSRPPDYMAIYGADLGPSLEEPTGAFASLKGRLPFPVTGRAEVRQVRRPGAGGPGLELATGHDAIARTVAAGRVVFADRYSDYGLTIIVDHGSSYYTVYGQLLEAEVKVGDSVLGGKRIGLVENQGDRSVLYFELRHGAETIDPAPWLGIY